MRIEVLLQRVHVWRPEVALAGVVEQHPQSVKAIERGEREFGQVFLQLFVKSNRCLFIDTFALYGRF